MGLPSDDFEKLLHLGQFQQLLYFRGRIEEAQNDVLALCRGAIERKQRAKPATVHESGLGQVDFYHRRRPGERRLQAVAKAGRIDSGQLLYLRDAQAFAKGFNFHSG
jgi:hypothetical protein